jgi:phenylacetate-coenzyme A ligase PaaK-like adenylate-forming protein
MKAMPIEVSIRNEFLISIEERLARQQVMFSQIVEQASGSLLYKDRLGTLKNWEEMSEIPLTSYEKMADSIKQHGLENVLIEPQMVFYHTSGSTGDVKRIYCGQTDVERIVHQYTMITHLMGIRPEHIGWNFGGMAPLVSGDVLDRVIANIPMKKGISTLLGRESDLIMALKRISREGQVDAMAGAAFIYYLIAKAVKDPNYIRNLVKGKLHRDYHVPHFLTGAFSSLYLMGLDLQVLARISRQARIGISYAEALVPYMNDIRSSFPNIQMFDVYGSTENPLMAAQLTPGEPGLSLFVNAFIAEIADTEAVLEGKRSDSSKVKGILWHKWTKGMR